MRNWFSYIFIAIVIACILTLYLVPKIELLHIIIVGIIFISGLTIMYSFIINDRKYLEELYKQIINQGQKFPVNFESCKIKTIKKHDLEIHRIIKEINIEGRNYFFESEDIYCDKRLLLAQLKDNKSTFAYYLPEIGNVLDLRKVMKNCNYSNQPFYLKFFNKFMDEKIYKKY